MGIGKWLKEHTGDIVSAATLGIIPAQVIAAVDGDGGGGGSDSGGVDAAQKALTDTAGEAKDDLTVLGRDQLAEVKRQYDNNVAIAKPVVDAQVDILNQAKTQGKDYYDYMVAKQRPIEDALNAQALKDTSVEDKALRDSILNAGTSAALNTANRATQMRTDVNSIVREAVNFINDQANAVSAQASANAGELRSQANSFYGEQNKDIATYKLGNQGIQDLYRTDIDADVGNAVADVRAGQAQATNSAVRQALRYGISMPAATGALTTSQAQAIAAAANGTRNASTDKYRGLIGDGINMRQNAFGASSSAIANANSSEAAAAAAALAAKNSVVSQGLGSIVDSIGNSTNMMNLSDSQKVAALSANRDFTLQDASKDWAKKLDVAGLYRGLPGASSGAYSNATAAGNSAVANTTAPSAVYNNGASQAAQVVGSGYQMAINGLGGALNAQTSMYNNNTMANATETAGKYQAAGSLIGAGAGAAVAASDRRLKQDIEHIGLDERTGLNIYEFAYKGYPNRRFRGVMADEAAKFMPESVIRGDDGYMRVYYNKLGIDFVEVK